MITTEIFQSLYTKMKEEKRVEFDFVIGILNKIEGFTIVKEFNLIK